MDALALFGALAVSVMLLFYALEARSAAFVPAFARARLGANLGWRRAGAVAAGCRLDARATHPSAATP
jgi:hypothetical protein